MTSAISILPANISLDVVTPVVVTDARLIPAEFTRLSDEAYHRPRP